MVSLARHTAILKHDHPVLIADEAEPVSYDAHGPPAHERPQAPQELLFCAGIEVGARFIEEEQSMRQFPHEFRTGNLKRSGYVLELEIGAHQGQVVTDRPRKEKGFLRDVDHWDSRPIGMGDPDDVHRARSRGVEPRQDLE